MDVLGLRRVMSNPSGQEHRGRSRPTGALRLAFRLPIYLYWLGLGQLLGHRFMLLTHRGRRSGGRAVARQRWRWSVTIPPYGRRSWPRGGARGPTGTATSRLIPRWRSEPDAGAMPLSSGS